MFTEPPVKPLRLGPRLGQWRIDATVQRLDAESGRLGGLVFRHHPFFVLGSDRRSRPHDRCRHTRCCGIAGSLPIWCASLGLKTGVSLKIFVSVLVRTWVTSAWWATVLSTLACSSSFVSVLSTIQLVHGGQRARTQCAGLRLGGLHVRDGNRPRAAILTDLFAAISRGKRFAARQWTREDVARCRHGGRRRACADCGSQLTVLAITPGELAEEERLRGCCGAGDNPPTERKPCCRKRASK